MQASELTVQRAIDPSGNIIFDLSNPATPISFLDPKFKDITGIAQGETTGGVITTRNALLEAYGGSGLISQTNGIASFVSTVPGGGVTMFNTYDPLNGGLLTNSIGTPVECIAYYNVSGVRIRFGDYGETNVTGVPGITFAGPELPLVEFTPLVTTTAYSIGDRVLIPVTGRDMVPFGSFTTPSTDVAGYDTNANVVYDAITSSYVVTSVGTPTDLVGLKVFNRTFISGTEYSILVDVTSSNGSTIAPVAGINLPINAGNYISSADMTPIGGNTYSINITPTADSTELVIFGSKQLTSGLKYEITNLVVTEVSHSRVICVAPLIAGSNIYTNLNSFIGVDSHNRKDFVFMESWDEDVSITGMVYPHGNVHYSGQDITGLPPTTLGTFTGSDKYSLYGDWQSPGTLVGRGYVWNSLSTEQQSIMVNNPDNGIHNAGMVTKQSRHRLRVVSGYSGIWVGHDLIDYQGIGGAVRVGTPQKYLGLKGSNPTVPDLASTVVNNSLAFIGSEYGNTTGDYGTTDLKAMPIMMVQRRNIGVYDPTYNPSGCSMVLEGGVIKWWYEATTILSEADCYDPIKIATVNINNTALFSNVAGLLSGIDDPAVYYSTGVIKSNLSGRPDGLYADEVNHIDMEDLRMDATKVTDVARCLEEELATLTNDTFRGSVDEVRYLPVVSNIIKTGNAITVLNPAYEFGYYISLPVTSDTTHYSQVIASDELRITSGMRNGSVLISGNNGKTLLVPGVWGTRDANGNMIIYGFSKNHAIATTFFNTTFPNGTVLSVHTTVNQHVKYSGDTLVSDIIGSDTSYPPKWLTIGVTGSPMTHDDYGNLLTIQGSKAGSNGGYIIKLSKLIKSGRSKVVLINGNVSVDLPNINDSNGILKTGTVKGYLLDTVNNTIVFNLTGTGSYETVSYEATTILQVFYMSHPNTTAVSFGTKLITSGDGYVTNTSINASGRVLGSMLTGRINTSPRNAVAGDLSQRFKVTQMPVDSNGNITEASYAVAATHSPISIPIEQGTGVKILPALSTIGGVARLVMNYKEAHYNFHDTLTPSDAVNFQTYGKSVAYDGTRLVVGSYTATVGGLVGAGKVYVYSWDIITSRFIEILQITQIIPVAYEYFGISCAIQGDKLFIGATLTDIPLVDCGSVNYYNWNSTTLVYDRIQKITASNAVSGDRFGAAISTIGGTLAIGATGVSTYTGRVYILTYNIASNTYGETVQINPVGGLPQDMFGHSVALSEVNSIAIGSPGMGAAATRTVHDFGGVYIYSLGAPLTAAATFIKIITSPSTLPGDYFGTAVAIYGLVVVVTAYNSDAKAVNAGKTFMFLLDGIDPGVTEFATLLPPDGVPNDHYGAGVALYKNKLITGASRASVNSIASGKVYITDVDTARTFGNIVQTPSFGDDDAFDKLIYPRAKLDSNNIIVRHGVVNVKLNRFLK